MQDRQVANQTQDEHAASPSLRNRRIIEHLVKQWQRPHEPSHDDFKRIIEFILTLPEEYKTIGLTTIADHFINGMGLHMLALLTTFQEKAEQEGFPSEEQRETFEDVLPLMFQALNLLNKQVAVSSLDEVAALTNITAPLYILSSTDSAQQAQNWLYELPTTYCQRLAQAGILIAPQNQRKDSAGHSELEESHDESHFVNWDSYQHFQSHVVQNAGFTMVTIPTQTAPAPVPVPVSLETNKTIFMPAA